MNWKDEFATGIHNIDDQHETILESISRFELNSEAGKGLEAMRPLLLRTRELVVLHFKVEESLMQLLAYPDLQIHRDEHKYVMDHIEALEEQVLRDNVRDKLASLVRHLLFGHVAESDKRFGQYALALFGGPSFGVPRTAD
jgi:hemerythrin